MRTGELSIALGGSAVLFILCTAVAALLATLFYRYTLPPLPHRFRILLTVLRGTALVVLLLVLFEPVLRFINRKTQPPVVAILVDASQSMTIRDAAGDRAQKTRDALKNDILKHLPGGVTAKIIPFSAKLGEASSTQPLDSLAFEGEVTNLSEAFSGVKELLRRENIQSVVLVSDGNYTTGKNPLYEAEALGIPMYTIGVGDTNDQKDILIDRVMTNALAYAESDVPIDVVVKSSGFSGENAEVTVSEGGYTLEHRIITLQAGVREYPLNMKVSPKEEGTRKYTVSVSSLAGELTTKNNTRSVYVKVLKSRLNIVLFSGSPHADVSAVRQILAEDGHITLRTYVQKSANEFYEGTVTKPTIDSADCIVMIGFPSAATGGADVQLLHSEIVRLKKPVLYMNGKSADLTKLSLFDDILPFSWSGVNPNEVLVGASVSEREKNQPLVNLEARITESDWNGLPPLYKMQTSFRAKPEAEVLAFAVLQNFVLTEPLVAIRNIARQKSFAITGEGVWRWRLMTQASANNGDFLALLVSNAVRWLTTNEDDRRIRIAPVKEVFTSTEPVEFTGQVYDEQLRPVDNAEVSVQLERGTQKSEFILTSVGNGLYEGSIDGAGGGEYTFSGTATAGGRKLGEDKGKLSIGDMNVEFLETKMNKQLLEQIAFRSGGSYHSISDAGAIDKEISSTVAFTPKELVEASDLELWNWKYLAGFIILLLATEWFLRKRSGML